MNLFNVTSITIGPYLLIKSLIHADQIILFFFLIRGVKKNLFNVFFLSFLFLCVANNMNIKRFEVLGLNLCTAPPTKKTQL